MSRFFRVFELSCSKISPVQGWGEWCNGEEPGRGGPLAVAANTCHPSLLHAAAGVILNWKPGHKLPTHFTRPLAPERCVPPVSRIPRGSQPIQGQPLWLRITSKSQNENSQSKRAFTGRFHLCNILEMTKLCKWWTDYWFWGLRGAGREGGVAIKGQHGDPCSDRTVLYLTAVVETKTVHAIKLN